MLDFIFRKKPSIFSSLFNELRTWCDTTIAFEYDIPVTPVDYTVSSIDYIDPNVLGTYFVIDTITIYDQDSIIIEPLDVYSRITTSDRDYFIDEFLNVRNIDEQYNNTLSGQYGLSIILGDQYDESTFTAPSIYLMYDQSINLNPLETEYTTVVKELQFDIGVVVDCNDLFTSDTDYSTLDFYNDYTYQLIFKYFNDCPTVLDTAERITNWDFDEVIVEEKRPIIRGVLNNRLTYI